MSAPELRYLSVGYRTFDRWEHKDDFPVLRLTTPAGRLREVALTERDLIKMLNDISMVLSRLAIAREAPSFGVAPS